jgi:hypothetical protein
MSTITVEEAKNLTNQTFFNRVWERAKDKNKANLSGDNDDDSPGNCSYRAPNGKECFIGCCIPDSLYHRNIEGQKDDPNHMHIEEWFPTIFPNVSLDFARDLQRIHDTFVPELWESKLKGVASCTSNLTVPA